MTASFTKPGPLTPSSNLKLSNQHFIPGDMGDCHATRTGTATVHACNLARFNRHGQGFGIGHSFRVAQINSFGTLYNGEGQMAVASQLSRSEAKPCHPRYLVGLATRTSAWAVRTGLCPITCYKPLFLWLPLGLVAMLRYLDLDHSRRTPWLFFQGRWRDVEIRLGLRPRNLAGYLDWIFWHTPRRGKKREAKMDQASFFFCGGRLSRPLAPGGPPVRGRSQGDPTPAQHLSPCGPTRMWPFTTATPTWKREDLPHCHARAVLSLDGGLQEGRITTRRTPVTRDPPPRPGGRWDMLWLGSGFCPSSRHGVAIT